jgi:hypothetical protein
LAIENTTPAERWDALVGLQTLLVAQGRAGEAKALLDSAVAGGTGAANYLYVLDALVGAGMSAQADQATAFLSERLAQLEAPSLWVLGTWRAKRGQVQQLAAISSLLDDRAVHSGDKTDALLARSLSARLTLARADTAQAVAILRSLAPVGTRADLAWGLWEPLAGERLLLAQLLFAQGEYAEARRIASEFDYPQAAIFVLYLPESLALRVKAAERLGRQDEAAGYRTRLRALSRSDLL